jgi:glycosyltransferase involved in cell wall biosynthesis
MVVSIVLPTYNREPLIKESIESVLKQTFGDFELLIMDDGSEDATEQVVRALNDDRVKYFKMPHSGHTGRLKNYAIAQAKGEYVAFIDSDDLWKEKKLERQVDFLRREETIGFCITDVTTFRDNKILIDHSYKWTAKTQCINIFNWLKTNRFLVYNPTLIIRKKCFDKTGLFDEEMLSGDYHFNMRLAYHFDAGILYDTLVWRRAHESNMSDLFPLENYQEYIATFEYLHHERMLEKRYLFNAKAIAYLKMARIWKNNGDARKARQYFLMSFKYGLFHPRHYAQLIRAIKKIS